MITTRGQKWLQMACPGKLFSIQKHVKYGLSIEKKKNPPNLILIEFSTVSPNGINVNFHDQRFFFLSFFSVPSFRALGDPFQITILTVISRFIVHLKSKACMQLLQDCIEIRRLGDR